MARTITQAEWDAAHRARPSRCGARCPTSTPSCFDSPEIKRETLESLVRERVLLVAATRAHFAVSDERLQRELIADPQFAALRHPDGSVDVAAYKAADRGARHDARGLRGQHAAGPRAAPGARRRDRPACRRPARPAAVRSTRCCSSARCRCSASTPSDYAAKISAHRRRDRRRTTRPTRRSSGRPSRPASNTWCSTSTR